MDFYSEQNLKSFLGRFGLHPDKKLGQNFLLDRDVLRLIAEAAELKKSDMVLEIGAGIGNLTQELAERCGRVIAVEKDDKLIRPLKAAVKKCGNVEIVHADILKLKISELLMSYSLSNPVVLDSKFFIPGFKVVANIPYYITGEILRQLLDRPHKPEMMVLLVQKEVAERITAAPGGMSLLSLSVQLYGGAEIIAAVPASAFWPEPEVDSAVIRIRMLPRPRLAVDEREFFRLARISFASRRKTLLNNFSAGLRLPKERVSGILQSAGVDSGRRAQELSLEEWGRVYKAYEEQGL